MDGSVSMIKLTIFVCALLSIPLTGCGSDEEHKTVVLSEDATAQNQAACDGSEKRRPDAPVAELGFTGKKPIAELGFTGGMVDAELGFTGSNADAELGLAKKSCPPAASPTPMSFTGSAPGGGELGLR